MNSGRKLHWFFVKVFGGEQFDIKGIQQFGEVGMESAQCFLNFLVCIFIFNRRRIPNAFFIKQAKLGNDSNLLIVFYVQIMPDDFVMQLHRF